METTGSLVIENARSRSGIFKAGDVTFRNVDFVNIYMDSLVDGNSVSFYGCTVNGVVSTLSEVSFYAERSKINCSITADNSSAVLKDCTLTSKLYCESIDLNGCSSNESSNISALHDVKLFGCSIYQLTGKNASIYNSHLMAFVELTSSIVESGANRIVWNSTIVNSVVEALTFMWTSGCLCRINWSDSTIRNLRYTECQYDGSIYSVSNCTVSAESGRVYCNDYALEGSLFGEFQLTRPVPNFLSFVEIDEVYQSGSFWMSEKNIPVSGMVMGSYIAGSSGVERFFGNISQYGDKTVSFIGKKDGIYTCLLYTSPSPRDS